MSNICRLCGSANAIPKYQVREYSILECTNCRFVYTTLLTSQELIHGIYKHRYFEGGGAYGYSDYEKDKRVRTATFHYYFGLIAKYLNGKKSALDIGCSDGSFLEITSKNGFEQNEGIELNEEMYTATKKTFTVYDQPLEFFDSGKQYDLVTLFDVLEHIPDLKTALRKLNRICRENGLLVILTPDYNSRSRKLFGKNWFQFKPPEHINYFTLQRLSALLSENGFETLYSEKGVSLVDHTFVENRLQRYRFGFLRFLFSVFGKLFFAGRSYIKLSNSAIFLIAKRVP